jgi:hypothetical protein
MLDPVGVRLLAECRNQYSAQLWKIAFASKAIFIGDDISLKIRREGCLQPTKV